MAKSQFKKGDLIRVKAECCSGFGIIVHTFEKGAYAFIIDCTEKKSTEEPRYFSCPSYTEDADPFVHEVPNETPDECCYFTWAEMEKVDEK